MTFGYRLVLINGVLDSFALLISNSFSVLINRKRYHVFLLSLCRSFFFFKVFIFPFSQIGHIHPLAVF